MTKASEHLRWAVDTLAVQPNDLHLEIGCGHGVAVSLICEKLAGGHIIAIDRSQKMVDLARLRNVACIAADKATITRADMRDADFGGQLFDKIFAIHVSLIFQQPQQALSIVKSGWQRKGRCRSFSSPSIPLHYGLRRTRRSPTSRQPALSSLTRKRNRSPADR